MLVAERGGTLRFVEQDGVGSPLPGLPPLYTAGLNGLRDIAVDPDFASTRQIYLLLTEGREAGFHASVYRATLEPTELVGAHRIFRSHDRMNGTHSLATELHVPGRQDAADRDQRLSR